MNGKREIDYLGNLPKIYEDFMKQLNQAEELRS